ncbi:TadE/TadG family type IV pilus assembly protein [Cytobacillus sp. FJAT-54145]|uniref:TadE/TadG family type IV pilus assembly protein n=1 Tax=Cytobacillus spartinae TaxID=3299023 RepID=A0ABW6K9S6_9BACI
MKRLLFLGKSEKGMSLAMWAVLIPVFIFMAGLILDFGRLFLAQQELQNVMDASTLAAANTGVTINDGLNPPYCVLPTPDAPNALNTFFNDNMAPMAADGITIQEQLINDGIGDSLYADGKVSLKVRISIPMMFGKLWGLDFWETTRTSWSQCYPV